MIFLFHYRNPLEKDAGDLNEDFTTLGQTIRGGAELDALKALKLKGLTRAKNKH